MRSFSQASLDDQERELLLRFVDALGLRLGDELHAVWLFGSRARGEHVSEESDVDLLVLVKDASWDGKAVVHDVFATVARDLGLQALTWSFSIHINTPAWLEQRRAVESFFIAEVDRDKIALGGPA